MSLLFGFLLLVIAASGLMVVAVRDPRRQVFAMAANGLVLALLFFAMQAPDVAMAELAVGGAAAPLLFLTAMSAVRSNMHRREMEARGGGDEEEGA
ncbi:MAG: DUF4040 domain-containing protein [Caulobacteraceae bacterium]|nr:DUF4040 domain-containing protein [Caulobacter sp.]